MAGGAFAAGFVKRVEGAIRLWGRGVCIAGGMGIGAGRVRLMSEVEPFGECVEALPDPACPDFMEWLWAAQSEESSAGVVAGTIRVTAAMAIGETEHGGDYLVQLLLPCPVAGQG